MAQHEANVGDIESRDPGQRSGTGQRSERSGITYDALGRWVERTLSDGSHDQGVYGPLGGSELFIAKAGTLETGYWPLPSGGFMNYYANGTVVYSHPDWLGTSRLFSTGTRTIYGDQAVAPYGDPYAQNGSFDGFFTGAAQNIEATDLETFSARVNHVREGRWLSPDPAGLAAVDLTDPQTLNRYGYVRNNPLSNVDPTGMDCQSVANDASGAYTQCQAAANMYKGSDLAYGWTDPFQLSQNSGYNHELRPGASTAAD